MTPPIRIGSTLLLHSNLPRRTSACSVTLGVVGASPHIINPLSGLWFVPFPALDSYTCLTSSSHGFITIPCDRNVQSRAMRIHGNLKPLTSAMRCSGCTAHPRFAPSSPRSSLQSQ